jgi:hypothetical protein
VEDTAGSFSVGNPLPSRLRGSGPLHFSEVGEEAGFRGAVTALLWVLVFLGETSDWLTPGGGGSWASIGVASLSAQVSSRNTRRRDGGLGLASPWVRRRTVAKVGLCRHCLSCATALARRVGSVQGLVRTPRKLHHGVRRVLEWNGEGLGSGRPPSRQHDDQSHGSALRRVGECAATCPNSSGGLGRPRVETDIVKTAPEPRPGSRNGLEVHDPPELRTRRP